MKSMIKNTVLGLAVAATALSVVPAQAHDHWRRHYDSDGGDALAAGIAGLAIGAIVGGLASQPSRPERVYIDPPYPPVYPTYQSYTVYEAPRYQYRRPVYSYSYGGLEPWTPSWYRACSQRYRSFDPSSGTFVGYDGQRHFCTFN